MLRISFIAALDENYTSMSNVVSQYLRSTDRSWVLFRIAYTST